MFTEPRIVWTPCSWINRIVWGLNFPKFRYDQVGQIGFYFAMCKIASSRPGERFLSILHAMGNYGAAELQVVF
jgi:hypothetical protein